MNIKIIRAGKERMFSFPSAEGIVFRPGRCRFLKYDTVMDTRQLRSWDRFICPFTMGLR